MNETEKQFFDTFGIEPYDRYYKCKDNLEDECTLENTCCGCDKSEDVYCYPEITDRILLELICLNNIYLWETHTSTVNELKNVLLNKYIEHVNLMADENEKQEYIHQVQALFKEG